MCLLTDGRFSGASRGIMVGHVSPEAYIGGPIALLQDGDQVTLDVDKRSLNVDNQPDFNKRLFQRASDPYADGMLLRYRKLVSQAH